MRPETFFRHITVSLAQIQVSRSIATFFSGEPQYCIYRDFMSSLPGTGPYRSPLYCLLILIFCVSLVPFVSGQSPPAPQPVLSLNFNEGSGNVALDSSGGSGAGTIVGATRSDTTGCGRSLLFDGVDNYVSVPYSPENHPVDAI